MISGASSLAFRSLLKTAASRAGLGRSRARLSGLSPAGTAFHAAALAQDEVVLLVVPTDAAVEQMVGDVRFFLGSLEGLSRTDVEHAVLPFPSQEVDPYRGLAPHLEVASARARALHALATRSATVVVASARALVPRVSDPSRLGDAGLSLAPGFEISPQDLGARLAEAGFTPEDPVDEHGEFCVRGGVVDFYPAADAQPIRLEFIGDVVESIRRYDAATQRSLAAIDRVIVSPQRELLAAAARAGDEEALDRSATVIDYARSAGAAVVVFEGDDVGERGRKLEEQWRTSAADFDARGRIVPAYESLAVA
jgi:transcription-repair coupling factor (superfamily II helicase)